MNPQMQVATVSFMGVVLSALIAFLVSRRQTAVEIEKVRLQNQVTFRSKVFETRLKVYPALHAILGDLGGKILSSGATLADVQTTWDEIRCWDRENSLFLSPIAVTKLIGLRKTITGLLKLQPEQFSRTKQRKELLPALIEMQMCLKTELGIIDADSFHNPTRLKTLREAIAKAADAAAQ